LLSSHNLCHLPTPVGHRCLAPKPVLQEAAFKAMKQETTQAEFNYGRLSTASQPVGGLMSQFSIGHPAPMGKPVTVGRSDGVGRDRARGGAPHTQPHTQPHLDGTTATNVDELTETATEAEGRREAAGAAAGNEAGNESSEADCAPFKVQLVNPNRRTCMIQCPDHKVLV